MIRLLRFMFYVALCMATLVIAFCAGRNTARQSTKDYQAACIYRQCIDVITYHLDDFEKSEAEELIGSIMENLDCYSDIVISREEIENDYNINYVF